MPCKVTYLGTGHRTFLLRGGKITLEAGVPTVVDGGSLSFFRRDPVRFKVEEDTPASERPAVPPPASTEASVMTDKPAKPRPLPSRKKVDRRQPDVLHKFNKKAGVERVVADTARSARLK